MLTGRTAAAVAKSEEDKERPYNVLPNTVGPEDEVNPFAEGILPPLN